MAISAIGSYTCCMPRKTSTSAGANGAPAGGGATLASLSQAVQQLATAVQQLANTLHARAAGPSGAASGAAAVASTPPAPTPVPSSSTSTSSTPPASPKKYPLGHLTPNQYTDDPGLTKAERAAACGPAAATAFARFVGKDISLDDVANKARKFGWNSNGMTTGSQGEVKLLNSMGIKVDRETSVDWNKVKKTVEGGTPVIVATDGHYFVAEQYNAATGKFNFGNSAKILSHSGGKTWFSPAEIAGLKTGNPVTTIYLKQ